MLMFPIALTIARQVPVHEQGLLKKKEKFENFLSKQSAFYKSSQHALIGNL
jgi:hypothetical protein